MLFCFRRSCRHLLRCVLTATDKIDGSIKKINDKRNIRRTVPSGSRRQVIAMDMRRMRCRKIDELFLFSIFEDCNKYIYHLLWPFCKWLNLPSFIHITYIFIYLTTVVPIIHRRWYHDTIRYLSENWTGRYESENYLRIAIPFWELNSKWPRYFGFVLLCLWLWVCIYMHCLDKILRPVTKWWNRSLECVQSYYYFVIDS